MDNVKQKRLLGLPAHGVWRAALTPLSSDLSIDCAGLLDYANFLLKRGCHGIGLFGTTVEANSFALKERMNGLESLLKGGISPNSIMVGTGCCAGPDTVALTQHALAHGVHRILLLPPFYYKKVSDEGLFNSFAEIIDRTASAKLELYLYHFPAMSQTPISIGLISKLREAFPNLIAGGKDSSGNLDHSLALASEFPDLAIFPGNETYLLAALEGGCAGVISPTANANSQGIRDIFNGWLNGNTQTMNLQEHAFAIREVFGRHPLVSALKQHASWQFRHDSWLRLRPPLTNLALPDLETLRSDLAALAVSPN